MKTKSRMHSRPQVHIHLTVDEHILRKVFTDIRAEKPVAAAPQIAAPSKFIKLDINSNPLPDDTALDSPKLAAIRVERGPYAGTTVAKLPAKKMQQRDGEKWAAGLDHMGHKDWKLMGRLEGLNCIWDPTKHNPAYDAKFWGWLPTDDWYWTRDTLSADSDYAWFVHFDGGHSGNGPRSDYGYVLAVRGAPSQ